MPSSPLKHTHILPYEMHQKWCISVPCKEAIKRTREITSADYNSTTVFFK